MRIINKTAAVVGATGLVGRTMVKVLEERKLRFKNLKLFATARSIGKKIDYFSEELTVEELREDSFDNIDIALFSAGGETSLRFAPIAAAKGCIVIDNSSAWRMDSECPLVVPEVNADALKEHRGIIANPNCSTIQLVAALKPVHDAFGLERVVVSTYQSITGAGQKGLDKLKSEIDNDGLTQDRHPIAYNTMFHSMSDMNGFTVEENKMYNETRKILGIPDLKIAVTCVRLPIIGGHAESVNVEVEKDFDINDVKTTLEKAQNIIIIDDMAKEEYPTPQFVKDTDQVYIGRIHRDWSVPRGFYLWVVADNLRKGAASNAVQIAEHIIDYNLWDFKPYKQTPQLELED